MKLHRRRGGAGLDCAVAIAFGAGCVGATDADPEIAGVQAYLEADERLPTEAAGACNVTEIDAQIDELGAPTFDAREAAQEAFITCCASDAEYQGTLMNAIDRRRGHETDPEILGRLDHIEEECGPDDLVCTHGKRACRYPLEMQLDGWPSAESPIKLSWPPWRPLGVCGGVDSLDVDSEEFKGLLAGLRKKTVLLDVRFTCPLSEDGASLVEDTCRIVIGTELVFPDDILRDETREVTIPGQSVAYVVWQEPCPPLEETNRQVYDGTVTRSVEVPFTKLWATDTERAAGIAMIDAMLLRLEGLARTVPVDEAGVCAVIREIEALLVNGRRSAVDMFYPVFGDLVALLGEANAAVLATTARTDCAALEPYRAATAAMYMCYDPTWLPGLTNRGAGLCE